MGSAILFIKTCLSAIGNRICQFWSAQIRKECGVWKRGSLQHCVWFKLNLFFFFFGKQNSSKPHLWGKPQQSELAVVFLLLCNWPTFPCFNTGKKKKKKRLWTPWDQPHSFSADHKKEAWRRSCRINTHCLLTQQSVKTFIRDSFGQSDTVVGL